MEPVLKLIAASDTMTYKKVPSKMTRLYSQGRLLFFIIFLCITTTSCARVVVRTQALFGEKLEVRVNVSKDVNRNTPVAVDLVLVYDKGLLNELLKMPASEWFSKREQFKRDFPDQIGFESWEWEWVPGQLVLPNLLPLKARAKGAVVFAGYLSPGAHRQRINPHKGILINLQNTDFSILRLDTIGRQ